MSAGRSALLVATDRYADEALRGLLAPSKDADALAELLRDKAVGGFEVQVLRDAAAQDIRVGVEDFFADRDPGDMLLLHFSCHGLKNADGELFLAASDTRPARLASTAVAADFVSRQMNASSARRVVLLLDCCYGGAFPRGMVVRAGSDAAVRAAFEPAAPIGTDRGRAIVTASSAVQYAFEGEQLASESEVRPSVFTSAIVDALVTGDADRDGDGWISLGELFNFVRDTVRQRTPHQTPQMWTFGAEGDLLIARSRQRRIHPVPLPPELSEALTSALPLTRIGLVAELRERVTGTDLGQALTAFQTLQIMTADDSRRVSEAAVAAIDHAAMAVSPTMLELGAWGPGQPAPSAAVVISGPPLVVSATATTPHPWIDLEQDGNTIQVTVEQPPPGTSRGDVVITGPTGTVTVPVTVTNTSSGQAPPAETSPPASGSTAIRRLAVHRQRPAAAKVDTAAVSASDRPAPADASPAAAAATPTSDTGRRYRYRAWITGGILALSGIALATRSGAEFGASYLFYSDHFQVAPDFWDGFQPAALAALVGGLLIALRPGGSPVGAGMGLAAGLFVFGFAIAAVNGHQAQYSSQQVDAWHRVGIWGLIMIPVAAVAVRRPWLAPVRRSVWRLVVAGLFVTVGGLVWIGGQFDSFPNSVGQSTVAATNGWSLVPPVIGTILCATVVFVPQCRGAFALTTALAYLIATTVNTFYIAAAADSGREVFASHNEQGELLLLTALAVATARRPSWAAGLHQGSAA